MAYSFNFYAEWVKFGDKIKDDEERINYYRAISRYGAFCKEPNGLRGDALDYFQTKIRPELDRQHQKQQLKAQ